MRPQPTQFEVFRTTVNEREFLSSWIDQNLLFTSLPGIKTTDDLTEDTDRLISSLDDLAGRKHPFMKLMKEQGSTRTVKNEAFTRKIKYNGHDYMQISVDLNESADCVGLGGETFDIVLNDSRLVYSDYVAPLNAPQYQVRIVSMRGERYAANQWAYTVQYNTADPNEAFPKEHLSANTKWKKMYAAAGEATALRGSFMADYNKGWIQYGGNLTTLTKSAKFTDKAEAQYIVFRPTVDGTNILSDTDAIKGSKIVSTAETYFKADCEDDEENFLLWGKANAKPLTHSTVTDQSSGYHVNTSDCFFSYASYSNIRGYHTSKLTHKFLFNETAAIADQRLAYEDYNWLVIGGRKFVEKIMDSAKKEYATLPIHANFKDFTTSATAIDTTNRQGVEFPTKQFVKLNFDPYGSITIGHWKDLDSWQFFGPDNRLEGAPISSWWGFCLNLGLRGSTQKNIEILYKEMSEVWTYYCGVWTPLGARNTLGGRTNNAMFSTGHTGAWFSLEWQKTMGFNMRDVQNMIWFVPNVN
jgi:hypothetical protein